MIKDPYAQFSTEELVDAALGGAFSGGVFGVGGQIARTGLRNRIPSAEAAPDSSAE